MWKSGDKKSFSYSLLSHLNNTRKSRCLAGEPKHFPFAIVFILKSSLTCSSCWKKLFFGVFWTILAYFWKFASLKMLKYGVRWSLLQFIWQNFSSAMNIFTVIIEILKKGCYLDDFCLFFVICAQIIRCAVILSSVFLTKLFFYH